MPQISVIVPVYKVEPYLRRCVDSILGQNFTDFELILVDDGSPDGCPAICDAYAKQDERVHVIHQQNGGLSAARNTGIDWAFASSDSQWLTFIDSDDWVHPEMLARLLNAATTTNTAVSICGYAETEGEEPAIPDGDFVVARWEPEDYYVQHVMNATVAWGKLYEKECFASIRYPVGRIHEDEFTTYKLLFAEKRLAVVPAKLYYYFQTENSIMHGTFTLQRLDCYEARKEQIEFFRKNHFCSAGKKAVQRYLYGVHFTRRRLSCDKKNKKVVYALYKEEIFHSLSYIKLLDMSDNDDAWLLTHMFPRVMWLYWHWKALIRKM